MPIRRIKQVLARMLLSGPNPLQTVSSRRGNDKLCDVGVICGQLGNLLGVGGASLWIATSCVARAG